MATKEELFAAVRLIHKHCISLKFGCCGCPLNDWCDEEYGNRDGVSPDQWPDPEEGGGEDGWTPEEEEE